MINVEVIVQTYWTEVKNVGLERRKIMRALHSVISKDLIYQFNYLKNPTISQRALGFTVTFLIDDEEFAIKQADLEKRLERLGNRFTIRQVVEVDALGVRDEKIRELWRFASKRVNAWLEMEKQDLGLEDTDWIDYSTVYDEITKVREKIGNVLHS